MVGSKKTISINIRNGVEIKQSELKQVSDMLRTALYTDGEKDLKIFVERDEGGFEIHFIVVDC